MATILHMSFRVRDPERSATLYAELLDGRVIDPGPQLRPIGVRSISFGRGKENRLADLLEFWPVDKHWQGDFIPTDPSRHQPFGHVAFATTKSYDELLTIAQKYDVTIRQEPRGPLGLTPVIYDYDGNFLEFFPAE